MMSKRGRFNIVGYKFLIRSTLVLFTIIVGSLNEVAAADDVADTNSASTTLEPGK